MYRQISRSISMLVIALLLSLPWISAADAQVTTTFVSSLGTSVQAALLYEPTTPGPKSHIALIIMHNFASSLTHPACMNMASRGYRILCLDSNFTNNQYGFAGYEDHAPAIKAGINYLRGLSGVTKVVIMGHSTGAPMMAFYQNVAQNGPAVCQAPGKLLPCPHSLAGLPRGDGLILLDSHIGDAFATLTYVDPAVVNDRQPGIRKSQVDMFNPNNGYNLTSNSATYSASFIKRYLAAQAERNADLIGEALLRWSIIQSGEANLYPDDMPFNVPGAAAARLWQPDLNLVKHTKGKYTLLKADGTTPTQIITSVRVSSGRGDTAVTYAGADLPVTVRRFLGDHALVTTNNYNITEDDITGVIYSSSNTSAPSNVEGVTVPLLIVAMTGHYFIVPDEIIYNHAASRDKTLVFNEGAVHGLTPCTACATALGLPANYFGDTVGRLFDYIDEWVSVRF